MHPFQKATSLILCFGQLRRLQIIFLRCLILLKLNRDQCDKMMEKKLPNFPPKIAQKVIHTFFYMLVTLLEIAQKATNIFGLLL